MSPAFNPVSEFFQGDFLAAAGQWTSAFDGAGGLNDNYAPRGESDGPASPQFRLDSDFGMRLVEKKANVKMIKKEVLPQLHGFPRVTSENSLDFSSWWRVESWLNFKER